jgi:hypothetical protein
MGVVSGSCKRHVRIAGRSLLRTQLKGIERDFARAPVLPDQIMLERLRKFDGLLSSGTIRQGMLLDICDFFAGLNYGLSLRSFSLGRHLHHQGPTRSLHLPWQCASWLPPALGKELQAAAFARTAQGLSWWKRLSVRLLSDVERSDPFAVESVLSDAYAHF